MPLTLDEYRCLRGFSVLYSGGLDSAAVAILMGGLIDGPIHLLTYKHRYGALFNQDHSGNSATGDDRSDNKGPEPEALTLA